VYDYLSGRLVARKPSHVVLDVNGIGYRIEIPLSTYEKLPREGAARLYTYFRVSEDDQRLYGFATEGEREVFLRLVDGVQQLGPSKAIAIPSSARPEQLMKAIEEADVPFLRGIRGIGEKLANRLVVELRGKLPAATEKDDAASSITKDAVGALVSLGFERKQADEAVRRAQKDLGAQASVEDVIKRSLAHV